MKRHKMSKSSSKKYFRKTAGNAHAHVKNFTSSYVMRGGIRL